MLPILLGANTSNLQYCPPTLPIADTTYVVASTARDQHYSTPTLVADNHTPWQRYLVPAPPMSQHDSPVAALPCANTTQCQHYLDRRSANATSYQAPTAAHRAPDAVVTCTHARKHAGNHASTHEQMLARHTPTSRGRAGRTSSARALTSQMVPQREVVRWGMAPVAERALRDRQPRGAK